MAYTPHDVVKPEVLAKTAVGLLDREVVIPNLFTKKSVDDFRGARDDTINMKVPGVLPFRTYGWRNNRSAPLQVDSYVERKIALTFGGDAYSAVELTDEQRDFDLIAWSELLSMQARAVGRGLENGAVQELAGAPYQVKLAVNANVRYALTEANRVLNRFQVPSNERLLVVGTDFEAAMENDPNLTVASVVGDSQANYAVKNATIGSVKGFRVMRSNEIDPGKAYAFFPGAFAFLNAAPSKPESVPFGATASYNKVALRWIRDYDSMYLRDRSIVNTYYGFQVVTDVLRGIDETTGFEFISENEHFVRGIELDINATASEYPKTVAGGGDAASEELLNITGLTIPTVLTENAPV